MKMFYTENSEYKEGNMKLFKAFSLTPEMRLGKKSREEIREIGSRLSREAEKKNSDNNRIKKAVIKEMLQ